MKLHSRVLNVTVTLSTLNCFSHREVACILVRLVQSIFCCKLASFAGKFNNAGILDSVYLHTYIFIHRRNLANNLGGGGQNLPWVLGTLIYQGARLERWGRFI
jgi:hypothetical protein